MYFFRNSDVVWNVCILSDWKEWMKSDDCWGKFRFRWVEKGIVVWKRVKLRKKLKSETEFYWWINLEHADVWIIVGGSRQLKGNVGENHTNGLRCLFNYIILTSISTIISIHYHFPSIFLFFSFTPIYCHYLSHFFVFWLFPILIYLF